MTTYDLDGFMEHHENNPDIYKKFVKKSSRKNQSIRTILKHIKEALK